PGAWWRGGAEGASVAGTAPVAPRAAVPPGHGARERPPEAGPATAMRRVTAGEPPEDAHLLLRRDARPGVAHLQHRTLAVGPHGDVDPAAARRVLERVVDEVQHHAQELRRAAADHEPGRRVDDELEAGAL